MSIDFTLSREQQEIQAMARRFATRAGPIEGLADGQARVG